MTPQSHIWIDPLNRTASATDLNSGASSSVPLRTWNTGVLGLLGGSSPVSNGSAILHFMSSSPSDGSDPILFSPTMTNKATFRMVGTFDAHNLVGSGGLTDVTPKNRAAGQTLTANLSSIAGAAVGQVLQNTMPGKESRCFVRKDLGGGIFSLTQPITISDSWPNGPDPASVDTYANGDTFSLYNEDLIDLVKLAPNTQWDAAGFNQWLVVTGLGTLNPNPGAANPTYLGDAVTFMYSLLNRRVLLERSFVVQNDLFYGCMGPFGIRGSVQDVDHPSNTILMRAGAWQSVDVVGAQLDQDVILQSPLTRVQGGVIGAAYVDIGVTLQMAQEVTMSDSGLGVALYGPGGLNVGFGRLRLDGVTAADALLVGGGITLNGQNTAFSATNTAPSVINGGIPITPTNVDTNGQLFFPGGGSIATF